MSRVFRANPRVGTIHKKESSEFANTIEECLFLPTFLLLPRSPRRVPVTYSRTEENPFDTKIRIVSRFVTGVRAHIHELSRALRCLFILAVQIAVAGTIASFLQIAAILM